MAQSEGTLWIGIRLRNNCKVHPGKVLRRFAFREVGDACQHRSGTHGKLPVLKLRFCRFLGSVFFPDKLQRFFLLPDEAAATEAHQS